jgi:hypothetical protein
MQMRASNYRDTYEFWLEDWKINDDPHGVDPPLPKYTRFFGPRKFDHKRKELTYDDYEKQLSRC